jgi:hypothetical protein
VSKSETSVSTYNHTCEIFFLLAETDCTLKYVFLPMEAAPSGDLWNHGDQFSV